MRTPRAIFPTPRRYVAKTAAPITLTALALALALAGCAAPAPQAESDQSSAAGFPVTIENCGVSTTYSAPPERAVAMNQHTAEVMFALGLTERMVGTAYLDDRVLPEFEDEYASVPVLADEYPSYEQLLKAAPDFVYAGYAGSAFDKTEGRGRQRLADAGIDTYANIEQCSDKATMETVYQELRNVAEIFGVPERAEEIISGMKSSLADVEQRLDGAEPVDVLVVDSIDSTIFTAGGQGIGTEIIERAGGVNVMDDVEDTFADVSIEQAAAREPEAILFYDYGGTSVEKKQRAVLDNPVLEGVPAVEEKRFAVLALSSAVVGVRVDDAVAKVAEQLHPDAG